MPTRSLPCVLTDPEILHKALASAELGVEIERLDSERAETAKQFKQAIKDCGSRRRVLDRSIRDRTEMRPVEVQDVRDERRLAIDTIRLDTGEVIGSRAMRADERQVALPGVPPPAAPASPAPTPAAVPQPPAAATLEAIAHEPGVTTANTEPVLDEEERAALRRQYDEERRQRLEPPSDPMETRFGLVLDEVERDTKPPTAEA